MQGCLDDIAARDSENAAKTSEANAKVSETNAKDSETAAKISEANAKDSENKAKASETAAKDSENAASASENHAKTSETNAKDSETASADSYMLSKSHAVGTENTTRPNDVTDNSKYYFEQSRDQATASAASAAAAASSENTATQMAEESADSAVLSRSWAVGDTDLRPGETADNAKYYSEQSKAYADSWKGSLLPKGTIPFAQLPASDNVAGHMYNILDAFESDSRFKDGAGYAYPAGTNVYWTVDGKWDCLSGVLTRELTMAEYNALSEPQKMNGTIYYISDADNSIQMATENYDGLMSHMDKEKLEGIEDGATRVIVDDAVSETSENAVQNRAITDALHTNIAAHNVSSDAHNDIRVLLSSLATRVNTLTGSDDTTLDKISEITQVIDSKASQTELDEHADNDTIHITATERQAWNDKQTSTGNTQNNIATFNSEDSTTPDSWTDVSILTSGEKHCNLFNKISTMCRNVRYLWHLIGNNQLSVGDGTITGAINELNMGFVVAMASRPEGGYVISEDSYVLRNKFGQIDIFCNVTCMAVAQNEWHTVALVNGNYAPANYRALSCIAINTESLVRTAIQCFVYSDGSVRINKGNLPAGLYVYIISGSYFK